MKRSDEITWSQLRVGVLIFMALLFAAAGVLVMGDKTKYFVPKGKLSVIMKDVAGLKIGAPVWLAGVDVGLVRQIKFESPEKTNEVEVVLEIERESLKKVGKDSIIMVKTRGLLGEKYVDVTPSQFYSERPETRLHGTAAVKLDDVMQKASGAFERLNTIVQGVQEGEGSLGRFAKDPKLYNNLVKLTFELNSFASTINRGEGSLGKLYRSSDPYDKMMDVLNRASETLEQIQYSEGTMSKLIHDRALYDKLTALADKSVQAADDVRELNRKLTSSDSSIGKLLNDREMYDKGMTILERADESVRSFQSIADRIDRGEGSVGKVLNENEIYDRLNTLVNDLDALVKDVKQNPKRYVKFSLF